MRYSLVGIALAKADDDVVELRFLGGCYPGDTVGQVRMAHKQRMELAALKHTQLCLRQRCHRMVNFAHHGQLQANDIT